jgi:hypothetical protein
MRKLTIHQQREAVIAPIAVAPRTPAAAERKRALTRESRTPLPYMSPYLAGVGIGLVLLLAFVTMGAGLGAAGAFTTVIGTTVNAVSPETADANAFFGSFAPGPDMRPIDYWLLVEILGVCIGALLSGYSARRLHVTVERGARITDRNRLILAFAGGVIMGFGAMLARGCTSGQGLTGGALLSAGSWLFVLFAFAAAYAVAPLFRRQWT